ncbi:MAG: class I SAM-dependent methyltransferase [Pyrinomonadaceae bacterium]
MYQTQKYSGSSPNYWEENWEASHFEKSVKFSAVDPLRPLFEEFLRPNSLMLEGGCGMGNYISYYAGRGYRVVGLDFAQNALKTLRVRQPHLPLAGGDVSQMPFADKTFDLYYSGGVVEHFEGGATESLLEARRVLKPDGTLLISVPFYNPLRKILTPFRKDSWRVVDCPVADEEPPRSDKNFFQYAYTKSEFSRMLDSAGLKVVKTQGYALLWGLYDLPLLNRISEREFEGVGTKTETTSPVELDISGLLKDRESSLMKRLIVSEDANIPLLGLGVRVLRWSVANMMMYVCQRST